MQPDVFGYCECEHGLGIGSGEIGHDAGVHEVFWFELEARVEVEVHLGQVGTDADVILHHLAYYTQRHQFNQGHQKNLY